MNDVSDNVAPSRQGRVGQWAPPALLAAAALVYLVANSRGFQSAPPGWGDDFQAALQQAGELGRPLVIDFYGEGCPPCYAMDREVLSNKAVQGAIADFVPVRVNAWQHQGLSARYGIVATPTYVITDPKGNPILQASGFIPVDEFLKFLAAAKGASSRLNEAAAP